VECAYRPVEEVGGWVHHQHTQGGNQERKQSRGEIGQWPAALHIDTPTSQAGLAWKDHGTHARSTTEGPLRISRHQAAARPGRSRRQAERQRAGKGKGAADAAGRGSPRPKRCRAAPPPLCHVTRRNFFCEPRQTTQSRSTMDRALARQGFELPPELAKPCVGTYDSVTRSGEIEGGWRECCCQARGRGRRTLTVRVRGRVSRVRSGRVPEDKILAAEDGRCGDDPIAGAPLCRRSRSVVSALADLSLTPHTGAVVGRSQPTDSQHSKGTRGTQANRRHGACGAGCRTGQAGIRRQRSGE
jgi:hypothetical protein